MFELVVKDIHLNQFANNKIDAIKNVAEALVSANLVENGYGDGMLQREQQSSTYLGNGIAIPHGTTTTRHLVKKTGVQVFHFPEGVVWGDEGQLAYIAIGIAASSNEHLTLLRQLTHVLSNDDVEDKLKHITSAQDIIDILTGKGSHNEEVLLHSSLLLLDIPADSLQTLQILNSSRLLKESAVNSQFVASVIDQKPSYLGHGIWLSDSVNGNLKNALAISRPLDTLVEQNQPVKLLITASLVDKFIDSVIDKLASCLFNNEANKLIDANEDALLKFFTISQPSQNEVSEQNGKPGENVGIKREFIVVNPHGLHTRPSSTLIKLVKEFQSDITVANLDGTGKPVSATSLMKIVALGAKKGSKLQFIAVGEDAEQALDAIGKAMAEGLGEGTE